MGDLGLLLWQRGDLAGAEPLLRRSLEISRQTLGDNHPNVSSGLSNLGLVVADRGDYATAERQFREALAIQQTQDAMLELNSSQLMLVGGGAVIVILD